MTERKAELEWLRAEARVQTQRSHRPQPRRLNGGKDPADHNDPPDWWDPFHEAPAASTPSLMSAR